MLAPNQHQESSGESRIDKMRKFLSSPLMRKKPSVLHLKTFGTPLDILLQKTPSDHSVPFIITRLCQYIQKTGLSHEGLFRISGNARSVERLRVSFDRSGDAPLETEGDVPSAAALLKLFLRELPDPIIPLAMHCQFLEAVKDKDRAESIPSLSELVEKLPAINYNILSYLSCFLKQVSEMEEQNRMSASSLGIVFGPNLFRVTEDFVGLKEQSLTNQIVTYFITDYEDIFKKEIGDIFPSSCLSQSMINSTNHQVTSMVSSWPEVKRSASKLSTWSLGPISAQMAAVNDSYLPLCASTSSVEEDKVQMLSSEQEVVFATVNHFSCSEQESSIEFSSISPENVSFEICATSSPVLSQSFGKKSATFAKDSGFQDGSIADVEQSFSHFSMTDTNTHAESSTSYVDTDRKSSSFNGRNHHSHETSIIIKKEITHNGEESSPKTSSERFCASQEIPEFMKETHKSYPRGRRRHVRHHKNKDLAFDERRSKSELRSGSHHAGEDCNGNDSMLSETSKNELQYSSTGTLDESSSDLRHSWPAFRKAHEDDIALSPLPQQLGLNQCSEVSVSPSAFRSYLSHRNLHLDPSLPPSPPVEQEDIVVGGAHEAPTSNAKQLSRKVHDNAA
ncbi:unconventional myosin-IXAb-like [Uloborus diversus]|uniref:unconventional myosin-IXAb-like n=1 Tax=Uloborus diversus TaxID=327109 RepID=UPI002409C897|nr:unconventional myosin-IXAb-like [Uloborus diversus]